jgi:hypothetical protein
MRTRGLLSILATLVMLVVLGLAPASTMAAVPTGNLVLNGDAGRGGAP